MTDNELASTLTTAADSLRESAPQTTGETKHVSEARSALLECANRLEVLATAATERVRREVQSSALADALVGQATVSDSAVRGVVTGLTDYELEVLMRGLGWHLVNVNTVATWRRS